MQISRAPIRDACRQLEKHNIVEVKANRGTFVRNIDSKEVAELYDVRAALDALAGERAAERMTPAAVQELTGHLELMEGFTIQEDVAAYYRANLDFHMAVVRVSANKSLVNLYESVCKQALLFRRTSLSLPNRLRVSIEQHKQIFSALNSGRTDLAAALLKNHVLEAGRTNLGGGVMSLATLSLIALLIAIVVSMVAGVNVGILSMGFAFVVGAIGGMHGEQIVKAFPSDLFVILLGVSYMFSLAEVTGPWKDSQEPVYDSCAAMGL